jgi:hypothetical protein
LFLQAIISSPMIKLIETFAGFCKDIVESSDGKGLGVGTSNPLVTVPIHLNTPVVYRSNANTATSVKP